MGAVVNWSMSRPVYIPGHKYISSPLLFTSSSLLHFLWQTEILSTISLANTINTINIISTIKTTRIHLYSPPADQPHALPTDRSTPPTLLLFHSACLEISHHSSRALHETTLPV